MSVKTNSVKVGDILHDYHRERAGRTAMSYEGHWTVRITEVAEDGSWAMASWNGNPSKRHTGSFPASWRVVPKEWMSGMYGPKCLTCGGYKSEGHAADCKHPRAVRARAKAVAP